MVALLFTQAASKEGNVRSLLLNETRAFVLNGISSGAFAGRKPSGNAAQGLLAPLFAVLLPFLCPAIVNAPNGISNVMFHTCPQVAKSYYLTVAGITEPVSSV